MIASRSPHGRGAAMSTSRWRCSRSLARSCCHLQGLQRRGQVHGARRRDRYTVHRAQMPWRSSRARIATPSPRRGRCPEALIATRQTHRRQAPPAPASGRDRGALLQLGAPRGATDAPSPGLSSRSWAGGRSTVRCSPSLMTQFLPFLGERIPAMRRGRVGR